MSYSAQKKRQQAKHFPEMSPRELKAALDRVSMVLTRELPEDATFILVVCDGENDGTRLVSNLNWKVVPSALSRAALAINSIPPK